MVLHVMECDDAAAGAAAGAACVSAQQPASAAAQLERLRVVEVLVARWNPAKGRNDALVTGV